MTGNHKKIAQNIIWLFIDRITIFASSAISILLIANHFGASEYGLFQFAVNVVFILELVTQIIDGRVVKKWYTHEKSNDHLIVMNITIVKAAISLLLAFIVSMVLIIYADDFKGNVMVIVLLAEGVVKNIRFGFENKFEYELESKRVVIVADIAMILGIILQVCAVLFGLGIEYIAYIQLFTTSLGLIAIWLQYRFLYYKKEILELKIHVISDIFLESLPLSIAMMASVIYTKCDSIMLGMLMSTKAVGLYYVATKLVSTIQMLIIPIQTTVYVRMLHWHDNAELYKKMYLKISCISTWISIIGVSIAYVCIPFIFRFLNEEYFPAIEVFSVLMFGVILNYNAILRSSHFTIIRRGNILLYVQIITVGINIFLNYFLITRLGMKGAAFATVCSQFISLFISNLFFDDSRFVFKQQIKAFNPKYLFM